MPEVSLRDGTERDFVYLMPAAFVSLALVGQARDTAPGLLLLARAVFGNAQPRSSNQTVRGYPSSAGRRGRRRRPVAQSRGGDAGATRGCR